jgi:hypothetical protein
LKGGTCSIAAAGSCKVLRGARNHSMWGFAALQQLVGLL